MKQPKHCKGCKSYHRAGHKEGTALFKSKFQNWCCAYGKSAQKAVGRCIMDKGKRGDK